MAMEAPEEEGNDGVPPWAPLEKDAEMELWPPMKRTTGKMGTRKEEKKREKEKRKRRKKRQHIEKPQNEWNIYIYIFISYING